MRIPIDRLFPLRLRSLRRLIVSVLETSGYKVCRGPRGTVFGLNPAAKEKRPLAVSHLDISSGGPPSKSNIWGSEKGWITPTRTLGGDDRCGVWIILQLVQQKPKALRPHVLFTTDEESGDKSCKEWCAKVGPDFKEHVSWVLGLDRRGRRNFVTYCGGEDELVEWVKGVLPEWEEETGTFSDLSTIQDDLGIDGINLSVGFYDEHSSGEFVVAAHLEEALLASRRLITAKGSEVERRTEGFNWSRGSWKAWQGEGAGYTVVDKRAGYKPCHRTGSELDDDKLIDRIKEYAAAHDQGKVKADKVLEGDFAGTAYDDEAEYVNFENPVEGTKVLTHEDVITQINVNGGRDNGCCQYCGRSPSDDVLHVFNDALLCAECYFETLEFVTHASKYEN